MYANSVAGQLIGGIVFFPPGIYLVKSQLNLAGPRLGAMMGSGLDSTKIITPPASLSNDTSILNDALVNYDMNGGHNGLTSISDLTIINQNSRIGSGALRFCAPAGALRNLRLQGMTALDMGWNVFSQTCTSISTSSGYAQAYGSIGIINGGASVIGWGISGTHWVGMTAVGAQGGSCRVASVEEIPIGWYLGVVVGLATQCTIAGNVLTVGGNIYPNAHSTPPFGVMGGTTGNEVGLGGPFGTGTQIIGDGISQSAYVTIASNGTGAGGAGTYNLSGASGINISTPQAMIAWSSWPVNSFSLSDFHTEACGTAVIVSNINGGKIGPGFISAGGNQAAAIIGSNLAGGGSNTTSPQAGVTIYGASDLTFDSVSCSTGCSQANWQIANNAILKNVTFINCTGTNPGSAQTDTLAFIDNGAGGGTYNGVNGHILTVKSLNYNIVVIGATLSGTSITSAGLTGANIPTVTDQVGGYGPNNGGGPNQQYVLTLPGGDTHVAPGSVININAGIPWGVSGLIPLSGISSTVKSLVSFVNCNNPPLNMHYADLPGQPGNQQDYGPYLGMQYDIVDGKKSGGGMALFGDTIIGGGSQAIRVYYNGTNWTRCA
jgi:hypothetical protein